LFSCSRRDIATFPAALIAAIAIDCSIHLLRFFASPSFYRLTTQILGLFVVVKWKVFGWQQCWCLGSVCSLHAIIRPSQFTFVTLVTNYLAEKKNPKYLAAEKSSELKTEV